MADWQSAGLCVLASVLSPLAVVPAFAQPNELSVSDLPVVEVRATRYDGPHGPADLASSFVMQPDPLRLQTPEDLLTEAGLATWDASAALGLSTAVQARGFSANSPSATALGSGKILLNGYPDVARRFVREPATIERMTYHGLTDAALAGASTPAGTLAYQSKSPTGKQGFVYGLAAASNGLLRWTADAEKHLGPLQLRLVAAQQSGSKTSEGVVDRHHTVLLASRLALTPQSILRLDLESQTAHLPFPFGTVYADKKFWYDKPYVSTEQSQASRHTQRAAVYWDHAFDDATQLSVHAQRATNERHENLLGFWTVTGPRTLSSYARRIDEDYGQTDWSVALEHERTLGSPTHSVRLAYAQSQQTLDFSGPQSIGAFKIDVQEPEFSVPFSSIKLLARQQTERYLEKTWALTDRITLSPQTELALAATHNRIGVQSSTSSKPMAPVAEHALTSYALTASHRPTEASRVWLGAGQTFEPNRGLMKSGDFLPPKKARQIELGASYEQAGQKLQAALFDTTQSNLAGADPSDKNYVVPVGAVHAQGLQLSARQPWGGWVLYGALTWQRVRNATPVSKTQGPYVTGTPERYGSFGASWQAAGAGPLLDAKVVAVGARPGDDKASFYAPGAAVLNLSVSGKLSLGALDALGGAVGDSASKPGQWTLGLRNVFDRRYVRALTAADNVWQGERRTLTLAWQQAW